MAEQYPTLIEQAKARQERAKEIAEKLLSGEYVFLDTETTGVTNNDEVINMAFINKDEVMEYNELYRPMIRVSPEALAVSGITDEQLATQKTFREKWSDFVRILNGRKLAIFNENFDERMIRVTCEKHGIPKSEVDEIFRDAVCTMLLYSDFSDLKVWIKMEEACHAAGINIEQDHLADGDVLMMVKLVKYMAEEGTKVSARKLIENITDKQDDPLYRTGKIDKIMKEIASNTVTRFRDRLLDSQPANISEINKMISECYNYDISTSEDTQISQTLKRNIFTGVKNALKHARTPNIFDERNDAVNDLESKKHFVRTPVSQLYNEGYSLEKIAKGKEMNPLVLQMEFMSEFSKNPNSMDLSQFVDPVYTDRIIQLSKELPTGTKTKPIKLSLPRTVEYINISTVLAYYEKGMLDILREKSKGNYFDPLRKKLVACSAAEKQRSASDRKRSDISDDWEMSR